MAVVMHFLKVLIPNDGGLNLPELVAVALRRFSAIVERSTEGAEHCLHRMTVRRHVRLSINTSNNMHGLTVAQR